MARNVRAQGSHRLAYAPVTVCVPFRTDSTSGTLNDRALVKSSRALGPFPSKPSPARRGPQHSEDLMMRPLVPCCLAFVTVVLAGCGTKTTSAITPSPTATATVSSAAMLAEGKRVFRFDTFGDEQLWTDKLRMHEVIEKNVDPTTALKVGLKVDSEMLPAGILEKVDLKSPATTVALLKMNAVVGVQATIDENNHITRIGVTCALCHSTVDDSLAPGTG